MADVGGTYARVALAEVAARFPPRIVGCRKYRCQDYPGLAAILADFQASGGHPTPAEAVVAIAGVVEGDTLVNANLPWPVSLEQTRQASGLASLELINDFEAVAYAIPHLATADLSVLHGSLPHAFHWPALVLGPGTGLGVALRFESGPRPVLAAEAGQASLAPGTLLELEILGLLMARSRHVQNEQIFSGNGLMQLYRCLCELRAASPRWPSPEQLVEAARSGEDPLARETLQVFCGWLGSLAGNLAMTYGAKAVYLAGGISSHIGDFLAAGPFRDRYLDKGVMSPVLESVPVWRLEHGLLGIIGAATWWLERNAA